MIETVLHPSYMTLKPKSVLTIVRDPLAKIDTRLPFKRIGTFCVIPFTWDIGRTI